MNIVPNSPSEHWGINIFVHCHRIISEIVSNVKFFINQLSHIWIKAIYQRITMVFPAIVLNTEKRINVMKMWPSLVLCLPLCSVGRWLSVEVHCCSSTFLAPSFQSDFSNFYTIKYKKFLYNSASLKTNGFSSPCTQTTVFSFLSLSPHSASRGNHLGAHSPFPLLHPFK